MFFKLVKPNTKLASWMLAKYERAGHDIVGLFDAYARPSFRKYNIYHDWLDWAQKHNTNIFSIAGHNCMVFSLVFDFIEGDKRYIAYITPSHNYKLEAEA